jgi:hypothetical protein
MMMKMPWPDPVVACVDRKCDLRYVEVEEKVGVGDQLVCDRTSSYMPNEYQTRHRNSERASIQQPVKPVWSSGPCRCDIERKD